MSRKTSHPWHVIWEVARNGRPFYIIESEMACEDFAEGNAALIEAAPELLAMCKKLYLNSQKSHELALELEALIKKADGG